MQYKIRENKSKSGEEHEDTWPRVTLAHQHNRYDSKIDHVVTTNKFSCSGPFKAFHCQ